MRRLFLAFDSDGLGSDWFKMKTSDWIIDDSESVERKQNNNEQQIMTHVNDSYNSLFGLQETDWCAHANDQKVLNAHRKTPTLDLIYLRG
jgi:hypothetical protein